MSVGGVSTFQQNGNISISSKTATGTAQCDMCRVRACAPALRLRKVFSASLTNHTHAKMDDGNTHARARRQH